MCPLSCIWKPFDNVLSRFRNDNYAVVILNTPINFDANDDFLVNLWNQARVRMTVDGGTQRWLSWIRENEVKDVKEPDLITGDMDSLPKEILQCFLKNGSSSTLIVETPDQNETDFTKALRELHNFSSWRNYKVDVVYVIVENCGRLDQTLANLNCLFKVKDILSDAKVYLIASDCLTWLLEKGKHTINIPLSLVENQEWCALLPIGSSSRVTTSGLKWNLDNQQLEFGKLVSSSNTYEDTTVKIETENHIIWSMGI